MAKQEKQEPVLREMEPKVIKRIESPTPLPRENTIKQMPKKETEWISVDSQRDTANPTPGLSYKLRK
jgi:hypothetical protein